MKDNQQYDVVIIGAGPAGLECAFQLKDSKLKVLLIDRKEVIGPKYCAGGVSDEESIVDVPESLVKRFDTQYSVFTDKKYAVKLTNQFKCFEREDFGQYQLGKLKGAKNITVLNPCLVKKIHKDHIETNKGDFSFKYLVGADGTSSIVRQFLGLEVKACMGLYYNIEVVSDKLISFYDPATIRTSYIWEFPHRTHNNVGIYFDPKLITSQEAKKQLHNYCNRVGYKFDEKKLNGALIGYLYKGHIFGESNNFFLIGDAGGFASRLHGGGMSNGMTSGRDVAKLILDPEYSATGIQLVLDQKAREDKMLDRVEKLPNWLIKFMLKTSVVFMNHPKLRKLIKVI